MSLNAVPTLQDALNALAAQDLVTAGHIPNPSRPVTQVTCDSRAVQPGALFVCKGAAFHPAYCQSALQAGAIAYVAEPGVHAELIHSPFPTLHYIVVRDIRRAMSVLGAWFHAGARDRFRLIGVTGTKGKSTTAYFVKSILDDASAARGEPESAILSTLETYDGLCRQPARLTTPEALELYAHFGAAAEAGVPYFTMEVSSQALKTGRVAGVRFDAGCFLNFGEDHIGPAEHPDLEDYLESKLRLFAQSDTVCVHLGTARAERVLEAAAAAPRVITFGLDERADIYGYDIVKAGDALRFRVRAAKDCGGFDRAFAITVPGLFNVENALAAIAVCCALGISETHMYTGLCKARVGGRMEAFTSADGAVLAIVDYAHNAMSFETLFRSVAREYPGRAVTAVFGCPGGKAQTRRQGLGEAAGRYSDRVILTEDDPGPETVADICREIVPHVGDCSCEVIEDRGAAIEAAILGAEPGTVVVIAGKGHEGAQKRKAGRIVCPTDAARAREALRAYDIAHKIDGGVLTSTLTRVLPFLRALREKTLVIAPAGAALADAALRDALCGDIALLRTVGARVVVTVPQVSDLLEPLKCHEETAVDASGAIRETGADFRMLGLMLNTGATPVLPVPDEAGVTELAAGLAAHKLIWLRDAAGLALDANNPNTLLSRVEPNWLEELLDSGFRADPALPDLRGCLHAMAGGAERVVLLDGRVEHGLMMESVAPKASGTVVAAPAAEERKGQFTCPCRA